MNKQMLTRRIQLLITPFLLIFMGIVLVVKPDFASALVGKLLGIVLLAAGAVCAVGAVLDRQRLFWRAIPAAACLCLGIWLMSNPLVLASALGRLAGVVIAVRGIQDIVHAIEWKCSMTWAIAAVVVGIVLAMLPMTASRVVFVLCGLAVAAVGCAMGWARLHQIIPMDPIEDDSEVIDSL